METPQQTDPLKPLPDGRTAQQVVDQHRPTMLAISKDNVEKARVGAKRAKELTVVGGAAAKLVTDLALKLLGPDRYAQFINDLKNLSEYQTLLHCAELLAQLPWTPEQKKQLETLMEQAREADVQLTQWAPACLGHIPDAKAAFKTITPGTGSRDDSSDVIRWSALFRKHWDQKLGSPPFDLNQINAWDKGAVHLLGLLGDPNYEPDDSPNNLNRRAYTLWATAYRNLRNVVVFASAEFPERAVSMPGIHAEIQVTDDEPAPTAPPTTASAETTD